MLPHCPLPGYGGLAMYAWGMIEGAERELIVRDIVKAALGKVKHDWGIGVCAILKKWKHCFREHLHAQLRCSTNNDTTNLKIKTKANDLFNSESYADFLTGVSLPSIHDLLPLQHNPAAPTFSTTLSVADSYCTASVSSYLQGYLFERYRCGFSSVGRASD